MHGTTQARTGGAAGTGVVMWWALALADQPGHIPPTWAPSSCIIGATTSPFHSPVLRALRSSGDHHALTRHPRRAVRTGRLSCMRRDM
jgi:hypothetical protein